MHQLICVLCSEKVVSNVLNDNTLGSVLIELANHANSKHANEYKEYGNNINLLLQVLPAYQLLETFVDIEATTQLSNQTGKLITEMENIISNALSQTIEVVATQEIPIELPEEVDTR